MKKAFLISESSIYKMADGKLMARGGGEVCFHNIARALLAIGIKPVVLAIREFEGQELEEEIDGVVYKRLPVPSRSSWKIVKYLRAAIRESKGYDYVFLNQFTPHLLLPWLSGRKVAVVHDVYQVNARTFWVKQYGFWRGGVGTLVEKLQLKFDLKYADKIMTVSDFSAEKIVSFLGERVARKIVKNPYPVGVGGFAADVVKENFMLFVGRFVNYKNPEDVLPALKKVRFKYENFKAVFVISRFEKGVLRRFRSLQRKLKLSDDEVILKFDCDSQEVRELFARAKVFVQPSSVEGQGIVVLEALASGTPVIAYKLFAYKGMLVSGSNSILVTEGDKEGFADACLEVLDNYADYQRNCRKYLGDFSNEDFQQTIKTICY